MQQYLRIILYTSLFSLNNAKSRTYCVLLFLQQLHVDIAFLFDIRVLLKEIQHLLIEQFDVNILVHRPSGLAQNGLLIVSL